MTYDDTQPTFLCGEVILTPGGFVVREPCRCCGGEAPYQRGRGLSICPTCCVVSVGINPMMHMRSSQTGACMYCGTTEGAFTDDDLPF